MVLLATEFVSLLKYHTNITNKRINLRIFNTCSPSKLSKLCNKK